MDHKEISQIIDAIRYKPGWEVLLFSEVASTRIYLQVWVSSDAEASLNAWTGEREEWRGGKVYLSPHMCRQEIVGAAFGAIRAAEEHEMREWFRYKGAAIYGPHLDPDKLAEFARRRENLDFRVEAMKP